MRRRTCPRASMGRPEPRCWAGSRRSWGAGRRTSPGPRRPPGADESRVRGCPPRVPGRAGCARLRAPGGRETVLDLFEYGGIVPYVGLRHPALECVVDPTVLLLKHFVHGISALRRQLLHAQHVRLEVAHYFLDPRPPLFPPVQLATQFPYIPRHHRHTRLWGTEDCCCYATRVGYGAIHQSFTWTLRLPRRFYDLKWTSSPRIDE